MFLRHFVFPIENLQITFQTYIINNSADAMVICSNRKRDFPFVTRVDLIAMAINLF